MIIYLAFYAYLRQAAERRDAATLTKYLTGTIFAQVDTTYYLLHFNSITLHIYSYLHISSLLPLLSSSFLLVIRS